MTASSHFIPSYTLYGEPPSVGPPEILHCERIVDRASRHNWSIAPHRHGRLHQVFLITCGGGAVLMQGQASNLRPGVLIYTPPGTVHGFDFAPGTDGYVLSLHDSFATTIVTPTPVIRCAAPMGCQDLIAQIHAEYTRPDWARERILHALATALLLQIARHRGVPADGPISQIFARFQSELRHVNAASSVAGLAARLRITSTHLSRVCRAATGHPASTLIREALMQEARQQLVYTHVSVAEIAYQLGYSDPAYFSRTFRNHTGVPPSAYRAKQL